MIEEWAVIKEVNRKIGKYRQKKTSYLKLIHYLHDKNPLFRCYVDCEKSFREKNVHNLRNTIDDPPLELDEDEKKNNLILGFYDVYYKYKATGEIKQEDLKPLKNMNIDIFLDTDNEYLHSFLHIFFRYRQLCAKANPKKEKSIHKSMHQQILELRSKLKELRLHLGGDMMTRIQVGLLQYPKTLIRQHDYAGAFHCYRELLQKKGIQQNVMAMIYRKIGLILLHLWPWVDTPRTQVKMDRGRPVFFPRDGYEEACLSLLLAEEVVLNQPQMSFGFEEIEVSIYNDQITLYIEQRQSYRLTRILKRPIGRDLLAPTLWRRLGLIFVEAGEYKQAVRILKKIFFLIEAEDRVSLRDVCQLSKCYIKLKNYEKALKVIQKHVKVSKGTFFEGRLYRYLGMIISKMSMSVVEDKEKKRMQQESLDWLQKSVEVDPGSFEACYNIALQFALVRELPKAFRYARKALFYNPDDEDIWILISLLFTSKSQKENACNTLDKADRRFEKSLTIQVLLAYLLQDGATGSSVNPLLEQLTNKTYDFILTSSGLDSSSINISKERPLKNVKVAVKGQIMKSNLLDGVKKKVIIVPEDSFMLGMKLLLMIVEVYTEKKMLPEAQNIMKNLRYCEEYINPTSAEYHYSWGVILSVDHKLKIQDTIGSSNESMFSHGCLGEFEKALVIDPNHVKSLTRLGMFYYERKDLSLATSYLQSAIRLDPTVQMAWYYLGKVWNEMGKNSEAADCFFTAMKLEKTNPSIPFTHLLDFKL